MKIERIDIAKDFSDMPFGRNQNDGPDNGERFREEILYPKFISSDEVHVYMDGAMGYGSSFLDEAFAGLYRNHKISKSEIKRKLKLHCSLDFILKSAWLYVDEANLEN
ncbi:hypothetical protein CF134_00735 [Aeromonas salmonicida]|uniref:DUF4325 domain protein n=1 Tax=Aeromonas salmonicida subsp. pectinolytica 34mel TaxID=1324960 RepID=T0PE98_AERSA|nr:STAS-like domain-containing protein [Aeromonas salmonicida]ATP07395.1 DUF4325 domain protein [Aeromonas salmonicida subsp. pectinolytica 34mel]EQC05465.1 hypothetical protein K931_05331 [Aeromonas salmonicida subsp. pectinolytica 34mel]TNI24086.1 hypothetical protein CF134_00735 [Aeromonas salmonicida]